MARRAREDHEGMGTFHLLPQDFDWTFEFFSASNGPPHPFCVPIRQGSETPALNPDGFANWRQRPFFR